MSPKERKQQEAQREKDLAKTLDDDSGRTSVPELDLPQPSDTRKEDTLQSNNFGYSKWMVTNVWQAGRRRLAKANIKSKRANVRLRIQRNIRVNQVLIGERDDNEVANLPTIVEVTPPGWTARIRQKYPEHYRAVS